PQPIAKWSAWLGKLAKAIGATVRTPQKGGDCELHPIETTERPRGLRAPGSLNPKDGSFGLIAFDTLTERLVEWRDLLTRDQVRAVRDSQSPKTTIIVLEKQFVHKCCTRYAITSERTRHNRLLQLVGFMVNQCGHGLALKAAAQQHTQAQPAVKTE